MAFRDDSTCELLCDDSTEKSKAVLNHPQACKDPLISESAECGHRHPRTHALQTLGRSRHIGSEKTLFPHICSRGGGGTLNPNGDFCQMSLVISLYLFCIKLSVFCSKLSLHIFKCFSHLPHWALKRRLQKMNGFKDF